ncbi:MAG: ACT domain-containing protein [Firmicutes bacterium]|nr:ACT domain-containing protein [Bacillota bacterium]MBQ4092033.1 ACT domain-containing protein [Bacillota bacterium]
MTIQQISVFLPNKPGSFCQIAKVLSDNDVNMRAMSVADTSDFGILRIIVDNNEKACAVLKDAGCIYKETPVVAMKVEDTPGALVGILEALKDAEISMEYMYAFTAKTEGAYIVCRVNDVEKSMEALKAANITLLSAEDLAAM